MADIGILQGLLAPAQFQQAQAQAPGGGLLAQAQVPSSPALPLGTIRNARTIFGPTADDAEYEYLGLDPSAVEKDHPLAGERERHDQAFKQWQRWRNQGSQGISPLISDLVPGSPTRGIWVLKREVPTS